MNAFNARSEYKSSFSRIKRINHGLIVGFIIAFSLQMVVMFGPLKAVFDIQSVPIQTLLLTSTVMVVAILVVSEVHKLVVRITK